MKVINHPFAPVIARWVLIAMAIVMLLLIASVAAACPNCKDGLAQNDPQGKSLAAGYYYSILFMMAMPFAILGTFGGLAYLSIRRAQRQQHDLLAIAEGRIVEGAAVDVGLDQRSMGFFS